MTDEIAKDYGAGALMTEYVSVGAKSYAYTVKKSDGTEKNTLKLKGSKIVGGGLKRIFLFQALS
jgi:hypothetical protein